MTRVQWDVFELRRDSTFPQQWHVYADSPLPPNVHHLCENIEGALDVIRTLAWQEIDPELAGKPETRRPNTL